jgi:hypothetical protein
VKGDIEVSLKTDEKVSSGAIRGSGSLAFQISDASTATLGIDYESPDVLVLSIAAAAGMMIRNRDLQIEVGGELAPGTREVAGRAIVKLRISKEVSASITQRLSRSGNQTTLSVEVSF